MKVDSVMIFVYGCVGALAPEIIRLYKIRHDKPPIANWIFYIIISAIFALLGGLVAVILPTVTAWGAFYAGVALPVTISAILGKPPEPSAQSRAPEPSGRRRALEGHILFEDRKASLPSIFQAGLNIRRYIGRLFY